MATSLFGDPSQTYPGQQTYGQVGPSSNPQKGTASNSYDNFLQWQMDTYNFNQKKQQATADGKPLSLQAPAPPPPPPPSFMPNGAPTVDGTPPRIPGAAPTFGAGMPQEIADLQGITTGAVRNAILNPAVSAQEVAQLKGKSKEQAALLGAQNMAGLRSNLAARGFDPNAPGYAASKATALNRAIGGDLLSNYRDIDLGAAQQNRSSLFQAINAGAGLVNDETQRQNLFDQLALQYQQLNQRKLETLFA